MTQLTVIIPTLQRSAELPRLVETLCSSGSVGELIVVNNAQRDLRLPGDKVRVLHQSQNIYVNPAWNLGVAAASFDNICLCNDDLLVDAALFDGVARLLPSFGGILGLHPSCFTRPQSGRIRLSPAYHRTYGFGSLMFLKRRDFIPIPKDLRIWWGDDWLFGRQRHRNWFIRGSRVVTSHETTSRSPEFQALAEHEMHTFAEKYAADASYAQRFSVESALWQGVARTKAGLTRRLLGPAVR
jgi:glycosyltransferase involved in cell wall biosynthesis